MEQAQLLQITRIKMTQHQCEKIAELERLKANSEHIEKSIDEITRILFGNGNRKGLKEKIDRLLGGIAAFKYLGGGGGLAGIIALVITIIQFFKGG